MAALPRLAVLAYERQDVILDPRIVDRNVFFARTFVESGTTRYRAPWDFLLALLAVGGVAVLSLDTARRRAAAPDVP